MAEIDERLAPRDGLNSYNVVLTRVDLQTGGGAQFTFALSNALLPVGELHVEVPAGGSSLDRMTVEAHDGLIDILRQLLFRAENARRYHSKNAARPALAPIVEPPEAAPPVFILGSHPAADPGFEKIEPPDPAAENEAYF